MRKQKLAKKCFGNQMKEICEKEKCIGCSACHDICGKSAISMESDFEGFLYPKIDSQKCVDCGMCKKVCPIASFSDPMVGGGCRKSKFNPFMPQPTKTTRHA